MKGVNVPDDVTEFEIVCQRIEGILRDNRWPQAWDIQCHLSQQVTVPLRTGWAALIDLAGDDFEETFDSGVEAVQIECSCSDEIILIQGCC
jgi:hypothetical protein